MTEREIVITAPKTAELKPLRADQPQPGTPLADGEVEGHTVVTAVSPGTELSWAFTGPNHPCYPGYAAIFRVERIGAAVSSIKVGDLVFAIGAHRSCQRHRAVDVVRVPDGLDPAAAVFTRLMCVSATTLATTTARPPAQVVVAGLGPIGNLAAQQFHACGYRVTGCDPIGWRRTRLAKLGIPCLPAVPVDDTAFKDQVELFMDCSGHEAAVLAGCRIIRKRGEVVLIATPWRKRTDLSAHQLMHAVFHKYAVLRSGWEWEVPMHPTDFVRGSLTEHLAGGLAWLKDGRVNLDGFANRAAPADAQRVYTVLLAQQEEHLSTVFEWAT